MRLHRVLRAFTTQMAARKTRCARCYWSALFYVCRRQVRLSVFYRMNWWRTKNWSLTNDYWRHSLFSSNCSRLLCKIYYFDFWHLCRVQNTQFGWLLLCRLFRSVTNPAFFTENQSKFNSVQISEGLTRSIANEALAKMMAIEKCDRTIVNPVYNSEPKYKPLVSDPCSYSCNPSDFYFQQLY